jgi:hypothetical protein
MQRATAQSEQECFVVIVLLLKVHKEQQHRKKQEFFVVIVLNLKVLKKYLKNEIRITHFLFSFKKHPLSAPIILTCFCGSR